MDETICPQCHTQLKIEDFFCFNCGKNLKAKPLSISIGNQLLLYIGSLLLPPLGLIWGFRYLRQPDRASKTVGMIAVILTVVILTISAVVAIDIFNKINSQVSQQLNNLQGF